MWQLKIEAILIQDGSDLAMDEEFAVIDKKGKSRYYFKSFK